MRKTNKNPIISKYRIAFFSPNFLSVYASDGNPFEILFVIAIIYKNIGCLKLLKNIITTLFKIN
jgi:hypothetical protein